VERFFLNYEYSEIRKEPRRRRLKMVNVLRILGGFLILLLFIEGLSILVENFSSKPVVAEWGTMEKGFWADVLFLRDENVFIAPVNGDLVLQQINGARVAQGELIASIKTTDSENLNTHLELQARLQYLNRKAKSLQEEMQRGGLKLNAKMTQLSHTPKKSNQFRQIKKDLTFIEQEKADILRSIEQNQQEVQQLSKSINQLQNGLVKIQADKPGYLFYQFDEWESRLSLDHFAELNEGDFKQSFSLKSPDKEVKKGVVIGKIIQPFHQIISLIIDPQKIEKPVIGTSWWFKSGENAFQCSVINQIPLSDGKVIVGLDDVSMISGLMPSRHNKIFIIYKRISGITIPVQALYKKGPNFVVKVVKGDSYKEIKVRVHENDGMKAIIDGIEWGTTIISR
jgi:hypothetical protein